MNTTTRPSVLQFEAEALLLHLLAAAAQPLVSTHALCAIESSPAIVSSTTKKPVARRVNNGECSTQRNNVSKEPKQHPTFAKAKVRLAAANRRDQQYVAFSLVYENSNGFLLAVEIELETEASRLHSSHSLCQTGDGLREIRWSSR